jgi:chromosome segregation ATPase
VKIVKLSVERFQCIESAEVNFGPGLNVLFGPNDLGKTSLAWAIRAALLLQHNSSAHERFVSWHGGGEPRVSLTLTDDNDRYWRITKTFGSGTVGRSLLESSKDGRSFTQEASARGVDDRLRTLFNWGLHKPGGRGAPHGMPASFITQVLLAEQDDVRKILFDASLASDEDESGRQRLTEALGALAQDPLFKAILDQAQEQVGRAFTPTGKQKRSAGSPFLEIAKRLEALQQQRDDLLQKAKETEIAEAKIATLNADRDRVAIALEEAREVLAKLTEALEKQARRDALVGELDRERAGVQRAAALQAELERTEAAAAVLEAELDKLASSIQGESKAVAQLEPERSTRREALDKLLRAADEPSAVAQAQQLQEAQRATVDAERQLEDVTRALVVAKSVAKTFGEQAATLQDAGRVASEREEELRDARVDEQRAQVQLDAARVRLRDLTSGDEVRARELRAKELENRRLELDAEWSRLDASLEAAAAVEKLARDLSSSERACHAGRSDLDRQRVELTTINARITDQETELATLTGVVRYTDLQDTRRQLAGANEAAAAATREREIARRLRAEADTLRDSLRDGVPSQHEIDTIRELRTQLQVAEARVGAVAVAIRPMRPIQVTLSREGVAEPPREVRDATVLSTAGSVVVAIDGVAEIDVSGGDDAARSTAAEIRARWQRDGGAQLKACGVETVEQLAQLRRETDGVLAEITERERGAKNADDAASRGPQSDLDDLGRRVAALETELGTEIETLSAQHAKLGANARQTAATKIEKLQAERAVAAKRAQELRELVVRSETELAGMSRSMEVTRKDLAAQEGALGDAWETVRDRARMECERVDRERLEVDKALDQLTGATGAEEAEARSAVAGLETSLERAKKAWEAADRAAREAQNEHVTARALLEATRVRARELDTRGTWRTAVEAGNMLDVVAWQHDVTDAASKADGCRTVVAKLRAALDASDRARKTAAAAAQRGVDELEETIKKARRNISESTEAERARRAQLDGMRSEVSERRVELAKIDLVAARSRIAALEGELAGLPANAKRYAPALQQEVDAKVGSLVNRLQDLDEELLRARGGLEQVGGAVVREQLREIEQALEASRDQQHQIEVEYRAWQLLVEALRASEATESQHLGRQLAVPVSQRFLQLTGGRYGTLELDADLGAQGIHAAGDRREIGALSAGTQDQLATLLRLCIAEQLKSSIILDDHLSQSDPARVSWFNSALRAAATELQIIFITCRPAELLSADELPSDREDMRIASGGLTRAIDLTRLIRRFDRVERATERVVR